MQAKLDDEGKTVAELVEAADGPTPITEIEAVGKFVGSVPVSILPPGMISVETPIAGDGVVKSEMLISTKEVVVVAPCGKLIDGSAVMPFKE